MIVAIANPAGANWRAMVANNLAVLRARSGRKVMLIDTDPNRPSCSWSRERAAAGAMPLVPARQLNPRDEPAALASLHEGDTDLLVDTAGRDSAASRAALSAAELVIVPVHPGQIGLANQYKLIERLNLARRFNPALRVLFVVVNGARSAEPGELAEVRAFAARVLAATLADTTIQVPENYDYGAGRCVCDAETCDPEIAADMHALYREVYAQ